MKSAFLTLTLSVLALTTYLVIHGSIEISFNGAQIGLNTVSPISVAFVVALLILLTFWTYNEGNLKATQAWDRIYCKHIREFMNKKNAPLVDNLLLEYPNQINNAKDVYYLKGNLLLKTANSTFNDEKRYPGHILKIGKIRFCVLYLLGNLRAICDLNVLPYKAIPIYAEIISIILIYQLLHNYNLL